MALWAFFALTGATTALLGAPVAPALLELRKRTDAAPLPTSQHNGKITNFAEVFSTQIELLRPKLRQCADDKEIVRSRTGNIEVLLVGHERIDLGLDPLRGLTALMCSDSATILAGRTVDADVYTERTLYLGPRAVLRAGVSSGDILLDQDSAVLRWLHARNSVYLKCGSSAYGRLSADVLIHLQAGCGFQHMHAPNIHTIARQDFADPAGAGCSCSFSHSTCHICEIDLNQRHDSANSQDIFANYRRRIRKQGDFLLPAHQTLNADIVATGAVRFGPGSRFMGSTKSYKDTFVDEGACIHGSLVCGGTLYLGERSSVTGPVMAEEDVFIASGARAGRADALTTVAARHVQIATGCELHGTVRARVRGVVES